MRFHASPTRPVRVQVIESGPKLVADPEHLALVQQGVDVWNAWRAKEPSVRPDLSGINLQEMKRAGADLRDTNLGQTLLNRAYLERANMSGADLSGAALGGATLNYANLRGAKQGLDLAGRELRRG